MGKLIYCTRTVPEMEKCLQELKRLWKYRAEERGPDASKSPFLALCLSSRRNMCVHERVVTQADRDAVDVECRKMTASWVRLKAEKDNSTELCDFYEASVRRADFSSTSRSDAAAATRIFLQRIVAATWIVREDESRRRRGRDVDI